MSISYRKINMMIDENIKGKSGLSPEQAEILKSICVKIYAIESSTSHMSSQQVISDIRAEIILKADQF